MAAPRDSVLHPEGSFLCRVITAEVRETKNHTLWWFLEIEESTGVYTAALSHKDYRMIHEAHFGVAPFNTQPAWLLRLTLVADYKQETNAGMTMCIARLRYPDNVS